MGKQAISSSTNERSRADRTGGSTCMSHLYSMYVFDAAASEASPADTSPPTQLLYSTVDRAVANYCPVMEKRPAGRARHGLREMTSAGAASSVITSQRAASIVTSPASGLAPHQEEPACRVQAPRYVRMRNARACTQPRSKLHPARQQDKSSTPRPPGCPPADSNSTTLTTPPTSR